MYTKRTSVANSFLFYLSSKTSRGYPPNVTMMLLQKVRKQLFEEVLLFYNRKRLSLSIYELSLNVSFFLLVVKVLKRIPVEEIAFLTALIFSLETLENNTQPNSYKHHN